MGSTLCADNKLKLAIQRARKYAEDMGSYSNVYKAFELLSKDLQVEKC